MAGSICLFAGMQRSGKSFLAVLISTYYNKKFKIPVYTNMDIPDFDIINFLSKLPINKEPKILLLDELHFYLNSRNFKTQADYIYFLNTICKRNIFLLGTCIHPDMIDKNLRIQLNYLTLCKSDNNYLYYKIFDVQNQRFRTITMKKDKELFSYVNYDTTEIPLTFHFDIENYIKLNENKKYFV